MFLKEIKNEISLWFLEELVLFKVIFNHLEREVIFKIIFFCFLCFEAQSWVFIDSQSSLKKYENRQDVVMVASTGRSGSTLLSDVMGNSCRGRMVLKTHLLPPLNCFQGKIIFIFSNPDLLAESAFHHTLHSKHFGAAHFCHMETADRNWLHKMKDSTKQSVEYNLLAYDALGIYEHLEKWLNVCTTPCSASDAQILAIKYENLWDPATQEAICYFLSLPSLQMPSKVPRGTFPLSKMEDNIRKAYNLGTDSNPRYAAYEQARVIWEEAPPFQFLSIL